MKTEVFRSHSNYVNTYPLTGLKNLKAYRQALAITTARDDRHCDYSAFVALPDSVLEDHVARVRSIIPWFMGSFRRVLNYTYKGKMKQRDIYDWGTAARSWIETIKMHEWNGLGERMPWKTPHCAAKTAQRALCDIAKIYAVMKLWEKHDDADEFGVEAHYYVKRVKSLTRSSHYCEFWNVPEVHKTWDIAWDAGIKMLIAALDVYHGEPVEQINVHELFKEVPYLELEMHDETEDQH